MPLFDSYGRLHDNLRISVTDRCNIRCMYCMPETGFDWQPKEEILTLEELERFVRIAVTLGVTKLRITGGEPLLRRNLPSLIGNVSRIDGLRDIALTTNGVLLGTQARDLYSAGLRRLNVHVDTLDRERFARITRRDELPRVLQSIDTAIELGFQVKLNAVAMKGLTDQDIVPLALYGRERGLEVRFIEFMPLDSQGIWNKDQVLLQDEMIAMLSSAIGPLQELPRKDPHAPATEYVFADGIGRVGFISSVSKPFCKDCNRLRLTADGKLRYCLFAQDETDLKPLLRNHGTDEGLARAIQANVQAKWAGHEINSGPKFIPPPRPMYAIGG